MVEEKRKSKSRFSLRKKLSSSKKKNKNRSSKINGIGGEGSAEFGTSSGSLHEQSEEMTPLPPPNHQAQHESSEEAEEKHAEKQARRKSKLKNNKVSGNSANQKNKTSSSDPNGSKPPNKKKSAAPKVENAHVPDPSKAPATAYGLDKQSNGKKDVQYTVNEKGESVQFSVDKKGVPELWLQVDHDQCLVSPMTVNSASFANASSSSLSTTQQSLDSKDYKNQQAMSSSKQDLFMKTSLLTIGEGGKQKEDGVRPKVNSLMGERPSDTSDDDDSIAAEEKLLNQFDETYQKASELPKPKGKKKATGKKKKKKEKDGKDKEKKKRVKAAESGDEDDRKVQPQSDSAMPSAKIPSLEERSSIKLPPAKNGKSRKIKRKSEKIRAKDMNAIEEEPTSPPPKPPPPPVTTPPSSGGGRRISRRIQRINSVPASTFATLDTSSPVANKDSKTRASVSMAVSKKGPLSNTTRSSTYESPKRMNLKDLRKRFGPQQSETFLSLSPAALAVGRYKEMPTDLQVYGKPSDQRNKRPGLKRKEYRMSQRSLRNLEPESSASEGDEEDANLVEYLKTSNHKLDI